MKKYFIVVLFGVIGCTNSKEKSNEPEPLQEQSSFSLSKRGGNDMVNDLYDDLLDKEPQLKQLETAIEQLNKQKADSAEQFYKFNEKSREYYVAAERHVGNMTDSLLKEKIRKEIENSKVLYSQTTAIHQNILNEIAAKDTNLNDLHEALKLIKTLPIIAKYQKENIPSTRSLSFINQKYNPLLKQIDTLAGTHK